jgi:hypothetical protein
LPHSLNAILESKDRVYLKHSERKKYQTRGLQEASSRRDTSSVSEDEKEKDGKKGDDFFMDLGLEPLKRILFDMKKITTIEHLTTQHDPNAARDSGLPRYLDFIHDKNAKRREHKFTQEKIHGKQVKSFIR